MLIKSGIPVSPGVAIARAFVVDTEDRPVVRRTVHRDQLHAEHDRLTHAIRASIHELNEQREHTRTRLGSDLAEIFGFHLGMLHDRSLLDGLHRLIADDHVTAEYAVYSIMREEARKFRRLEHPVFRERYKDVWDLERRLLSHLIRDMETGLGQFDRDAAIVAYDLTPSQTASLDKSKVHGLVTVAGGRTSHTAILAHALEIPAVVGVEGLIESVNTGDTIIIDANAGLVIIDPDASQLHDYRERIRAIEEARDRLTSIRELPSVTVDGVEVVLLANIEFPTEAPQALEWGAQGIGLYRTEFLYLAHEREPSEEEQYEAYCLAIRSLRGRPLTIRTLDLGADKLKTGVTERDEPNPFLGCRSIRLCLQDLPLFKTQLRAILRASVEGPVQVMFPLISNVLELRQARMILGDVREDLQDRGIPVGERIPVGIMIEVPSAAIQARVLAREADFFSIGTNDLVQYTLAVDRGNERVASLYSAAHPAVLQLIRQTVEAGRQAKIEVSICGEMAGEPEYLMLLLGLGLRRLSMTPPAIPEAKRVIRALTMEQCEKLAHKALNMDTDRAVLNLIRNEVQRILPQG
jgi:phosphotransferase system enzyme I (PtsI)